MMSTHEILPHRTDLGFAWPTVKVEDVVPCIVSDDVLAAPLDIESVESALIFAPHPDDEALGCGGLIAALRERGKTVDIAIVTDGRKSHPRSQLYPPERLARIRRAEADRSAHILGVPARNVHHLGYRDGELPEVGTSAFAALVSRLAAMLRTCKAKTMIIPWRKDPHPDHRAVFQAACDAALRLITPPRVLEYTVWSSDVDPLRLEEGEDSRVLRFDMPEYTSQKTRAIAAHRSQTSNLIVDDPQGFRMSEAMISGFSRPVEFYFSR